jgi:predicted ATPase/class 3 adenylate cyclase
MLPTGAVTFLFTDVEGSTGLLKELGEKRYADALAEHRRLLREAFAAHGGSEVDTQGDAFFFVFTDANAALQAAEEGQRALSEPSNRLLLGTVRVRMGVHTGEPLRAGDGYVGMDVHRGARIAAAGHGSQVLVSEQTRAALTGTVPVKALHDLGEQRLKDLGAPIRLFQLGEGEFPPLKVLYRSTLPVQPSPLVGRERELDEAGALLREHRLVTLTGPGGSGKTRLALQLAAEFAEDFPDGVYWVALQALRDHELVLPSIAQAIDAKGDLAGHVGDRRLLLLLDNLEQLLPAAPGLSDLLSRAPNLKLLATSREQLRVAGEREYAVDPLPLDHAVVLFVERAAQAEPREAVEAICLRLDCLPLAVELAAARAKLLAPQQLLARLEQALPVLTGGRRDAPERQRTLRSTIEWSYRLLDDQEQRLFRLLAVFAGGFDLEAAEQVADADLDTLQSLLDKSLLRRWGSGRFGMLETIHEYATERLNESGEAAQARSRHVDWVLTAVLRGAEPHWGRTADEWFTRVHAELDNVRVALDSLAGTADGERVRAICLAMRGYWHLHGPATEGLARLEWARTFRDVDEDFGILEGIFTLARVQRDEERARVTAEEIVAIGRRRGDPEAVVAGLRNLGILSSMAGEADRAIAQFEQALELARKHHLDGFLPGLTGNLGAAELYRRNWPRARTLSSESAAFARERGDLQALVVSRFNEGFAALREADLGAARVALDEALGLAVERDWRSLAPEILDALAGVVAGEGDRQRAARLMGAAQALREEANVTPEAVEDEHRRRMASLLRTELGEQQFRHTFEAGRALSLAEAAELAIP